MLTTAALDYTSFRLADFYKVNQTDINNSMVRVASGKRFSQPSDDSVDYFHVSSLNADMNGLDYIQQNIRIGSALIDTVKQAGDTVFNDISHMQDLLKSYYNPGSTDDDRSADAVDFDTTKSRVMSEIASTYYDGRKLVDDSSTNPLMTIQLDPHDRTSTCTISYGAADVADVSGLTLGVTDQATESAALQDQLNKAASYLAKTNVFSDSLATYSDLTEQKNEQYSNCVENTSGVDEGNEIMALVKQNISQQMTVSMMAQAANFRIGIASIITGGK
jgi:flagellin-like hook-associated protein FlgL